jgi:hypothetical protein
MADVDQTDKNRQASGGRSPAIGLDVHGAAIPQAQRKPSADRENVIVLSPKDQLALWNALNETPELTPAQKRLSKMMRGEP